MELAVIAYELGRGVFTALASAYTAAEVDAGEFELVARYELSFTPIVIKARPMRFSTLQALCRELDCQPGDLLMYVPEEEDDPTPPHTATSPADMTWVGSSRMPPEVSEGTR